MAIEVLAMAEPFIAPTKLVAQPLHAQLSATRHTWFLLPMLRTLALLLPALVFGTGCAYVAVPLPASGKPVLSGRVIEKKEARFIVPGVTTRDEVIEAFGSNFRTSGREAAISYSWTQKGGDMLWFSAVVTDREGVESVLDAGKTAWTCWRALFIDFDPSGHVLKAELVKLNSNFSVDTQRDEWSAKVRGETLARKQR
ncbi:MAG: hypothetical protein EB141_06655 [Verrucomicrobia bacterium]|nr:hypothetical protein [Verrucomicrobiota bacterium]NBU10320.1 hypothetical protein [Pseudomonadota bacterium]NDA66609.1 hypothetical protein [Verrucomicrobiota bacterium]NDB75313.1 hypothetical protein [Verrucomicrobiota bacterium]NDE98317.1 hypothetical protein [Verrucomicrobiota bacterium]